MIGKGQGTDWSGIVREMQNYLESQGKVGNCTSLGRKCASTHTHPFNSPLSGTTRVSRYQRKTNLDFTGARASEWQWHQLDRMQVCTSIQTDNHTSTPPLSFYRRMPFPPPNQQRQSSEGKNVPVIERITYFAKQQTVHEMHE